MLRNETKQNKKLANLFSVKQSTEVTITMTLLFMISNSQNPASQITFLSLQRSSVSFEAINNFYATGISIFLITTPQTPNIYYFSEVLM